MRRLLVIYLILLAYLSLYPFRFSAAMLPHEPPWSVPDMVANVVAFIPLGMFCRALFADKAQILLSPRLALALSLAVFYAALLQWAQMFVPGRSASLMDVGMNTIGIGIGALCAPVAYAKGWQKTLRQVLSHPAGWLLLFWCAHLLSPFIPATPAYAWWQWLREWSQPFSWWLVGTHAAAWAFLLSWVRVSNTSNDSLANAFVPIPLSIKPLLVLAIILFVAMFFIRYSGLRMETLLGFLLALIIHQMAAHFFAQTWLRRALLLTLLAVIVLRGLSPWAWASDHPVKSFQWWPFASLVLGDPRTAIQVLLEKSFWYGALLLGAEVLAIRRMIWVLMLAGILLAIELAQLFMWPHVSESTDIVLLCLLFFGWRQLEQHHKAQASGT